MKKQLLIFFIVLLSLLDCFLIFRQFKMNKNIKLSISQCNQLQSLNNIAISNLKLQVSLSYRDTFSIDDSLKEKIKSERVVVLYISDGICGSCLQELFNYMEQLGSVIGKDKLLLLGNFVNENDFKSYTNIAAPYFDNFMYYSKVDSDFNIKEQPVVFVLNNELKRSLIFVPNFFPEYKETYFYSILPKYFLKRTNS